MIGSGARAPFPILRTFYSAGRMPFGIGHRGRGGNGSETPQQILNCRYASGEITKEQYEAMLDPAGRVVDWNVGAEHVLGYGSEILGQPFAVFFPPDDRTSGVPERELTLAAETGQCSDDRWHVRKNGSYFWAFGITTAMRDENGTLKGFAKILRDSTERKRFEEQLEEKNKALQQADRQKDEFLAMPTSPSRCPNWMRPIALGSSPSVAIRMQLVPNASIR